MRTLIRNGRVVTAVDDYRADVLVEGEKVSTIGAKLDVETFLADDATNFRAMSVAGERGGLICARRIDHKEAFSLYDNT